MNKTNITFKPNELYWGGRGIRPNDMKYRKKPVVIDTIQWNGFNVPEIKAFMGIEIIPWNAIKDQLLINTLEGDHIANKGDWIIKGVKGEFYPCKPDIFEMTYEKVNDEESMI